MTELNVTTQTQVDKQIFDLLLADRFNPHTPDLVNHFVVNNKLVKNGTGVDRGVTITTDNRYQTLSARRGSFVDWFFKPTADVMAKNGFFYTGKGDMCQCFSCGLQVKGLGPNVDIQALHKRQALLASETPDVYGCLFLKMTLPSPKQERELQRQQHHMQRRGMVVCDAEDADDKVPYGTESERLKSFTRFWPRNQFSPTSAVTPLNLAKAGFYYMQTTDKVCCFSCKQKLYKWSDSDIPMDEHVRVRNGRPCKWLQKCGRQYGNGAPVDQRYFYNHHHHGEMSSFYNELENEGELFACDEDEIDMID